MSIHILVDDFSCDIDEFYTAVSAEINKRQLANIKYDWKTELGAYGWFDEPASARALEIQDGLSKAFVMLWQYGTGLVITTRHEWLNPTKVAKAFDRIGGSHMTEVQGLAFTEAVDRATRAVLQQVLAGRGAECSAAIDPKDVFMRTAQV